MVALVVEPSERAQFYVYLLATGIFFALLGILILTVSEWGWSLLLIGVIFCLFSIAKIIARLKK